MSKNTSSKNPAARSAREDFWQLRLYIAGLSPNSVAAIANLKKICEDQLKGKYRIEVIDLLEKPQLAKGDQIIAIPTVVSTCGLHMERQPHRNDRHWLQWRGQCE